MSASYKVFLFPYLYSSTTTTWMNFHCKQMKLFIQFHAIDFFCNSWQWHLYWMVFICLMRWTRQHTVYASLPEVTPINQRIYRTIKTATLKRTFKCRVVWIRFHISVTSINWLSHMKHANKPNEGTPLFCYIFLFFFNKAIWVESKIVYKCCNKNALAYIQMMTNGYSYMINYPRKTSCFSGYLTLYLHMYYVGFWLGYIYEILSLL